MLFVEKLCCGKSQIYSLVCMAIIWLLAFQNALERVWGPFSYIDEFAALIGAVWGLYEIIVRQKGKATKDQLWVGIPLLIFALTGLLGNLLFRYQPIKAAVIDLYTNLKFFFAIGTGYFLFRDEDWKDLKKTVIFNAKCITLVLFGIFLADRVFVFWPLDVRHKIRSAVLFFQHPTYLAGVMAFLITLLTVFYEKRNIAYLGMALVMMAFTMRSKAIASAAFYVALFVFFLVLRWRLKWWYVVIGGILCAMVAWPQLQYYYVDSAENSPRFIMLITSFVMMKEYFPIGTGFGTYASAEAAKNYSPVYRKYGFNNYWELRDIRDIDNSLRLIRENPWLTKQFRKDFDLINRESYLSDTFWPIIFGQTGVLGTLMYLLALGGIVKRCLAVEKFDRCAYVGVLFILAYLLIASTAETAFHSPIAIPLAVVIGIVFGHMSVPEKEGT